VFPEGTDSEYKGKEKLMRREPWLVCLVAAVVVLVAQVRMAWGQYQDRSADAIEQAKRESATYVKAFNDHKAKDVAAVFTHDADFAFLQGPSVERLEYGMVRGREEIVACHETFFCICPDSRLAQTVVSARLIRPDVLIADVDFEINGLPSDSGPIRGRSVVIRLKEGGAWKIAADRNVSKTPPAK
jgi:uncharacterized protein (TIGR02246 family)